MNIIFDDETLAAALSNLPGPVHELVARTVDDAKAADLWQLTCILVVDPDDHAGDIQGVLGFDPLLGPLGNAGGEFIPWWNWLEHHQGFFELLHTVGDEGFAYFLFVPHVGPDRSGLAALCRRFSEQKSTDG